MTKDLVKKAYQVAEQELESKQIEKIKNVVKDTLIKIKDIDEAIDELKNNIKQREEEKKILKLDIDDLKEGRLDRIEERQKTDDKCKKISVIIVKKEVHHHHYDWWHQPYTIQYVPYYPTSTPQTWCFGNTTLAVSPISYSGSSGGLVSTTDGSAYIKGGSFPDNTLDAVFTVNASVAKNNVIGTYSIGDKTVHLR